MNLPDFNTPFEYENNFYLSCQNARLAKFLAHYELYKMITDLPGDVVECGVFKGASFVRFAAFRELLNNRFARKLVGFDTFGDFPETNFEEDIKYRENFVQTSGIPITVNQLNQVLDHKGVNTNIHLVKGDVTKTVPAYIEENPHMKIALLNLDTDVYEPAVTILEHFYPRIVKGGVCILDDYNVFPGETKAIDDYFKDKDVIVKKLPFAVTPCYIIKNEM